MISMAAGEDHTSPSVGLVRRGYEAWNRGDVDAVFSFLDPDISWEGYTHLPESGSLSGRDEVKAWLERFLDAWKDVDIEVTELFETKDRVVALVRFHARGKGSGVQVASGVDAHVWTLRDGKAVAVRLHQGTREVLEQLERGR